MTCTIRGDETGHEALTTAQTSITVEIYEMGFGGILDQLGAKATAGVNVREILAKAQIRINQKYSDQLAAAGVHVKWSDPPFTYQHAKFFVVDGKVAVISTGNYSKDSRSASWL